MFDLTLNISLSNVCQYMKRTLITVIISLFAYCCSSNSGEKNADHGRIQALLPW